jgi:hypothetical protein
MIDRTHPAVPLLRFLGATETLTGSSFPNAPPARVDPVGDVPRLLRLD